MFGSHNGLILYSYDSLLIIRRVTKRHTPPNIKYHFQNKKILNHMYCFKCSASLPWRYRMKGIASIVYDAMKIPHFLFAIPKKNASLKNINNSTIDKLRLEISKRKLSSTFVVMQNFCLKKITNNHFGCRFLSTCDAIFSHKEKFMLYVKRAYGNS